jgi:hypothetical protein
LNQDQEGKFWPARIVSVSSQLSYHMPMSLRSMTKRIVKGKQEQDIPWFNDDFGADWEFEDVVEALTLYKSFYGDFSNFTNEEFVIPVPGGSMSPFDDDDDGDMASYDTDASARAAAAIASYEDSGEMAMTEDLIEAEIARLQEEVLSPTRKVAVATGNAVNVKWPEHLEGMGLGNLVARIRDGSLEVKHLPERKKQLDSIGFDWGDPNRFLDVPFEKAMCSMYAYYLVRGDMFVRDHFVMPDEDPWPRALAGYEIGKAVKRIRELQNFFEAYHVDKVYLLRMIDFVWFPTLAHNIDPNEPFLTPELLQLSAFGHPDYAKMHDIPMGLTDKIIADGPFFETDNPKLWWRKWHNWDYVEDYWYGEGRRDNAFVLRGMGYNQMGDEHEEKYGPGLFAQITGTMKILADGVVDKDPEEKKELLEKLTYYQTELEECLDLRSWDLQTLKEDIDTQMLALTTGEEVFRGEEQLESAIAMVMEYEEEEVEEEQEEYEEEKVEEEEEIEAEEVEAEEDFDFEDELGLSPLEEEN